MAEMRPLYVPVILGTTRKGRMSLPVARLMADGWRSVAGWRRS